MMLVTVCSSSSGIVFHSSPRTVAQGKRPKPSASSGKQKSESAVPAESSHTNPFDQPPPAGQCRLRVRGGALKPVPPPQPDTEQEFVGHGYLLSVVDVHHEVVIFIFIPG